MYPSGGLARNARSAGIGQVTLKLAGSLTVWISMKKSHAAIHLKFAALMAIGLLTGLPKAYADFPIGPSPRIAAAKPVPAPSWHMGQAAPVLNVVNLRGQPVTLAAFAGKPLLLEFGSLTEPAFRLSAGSVTWLARKWRGKISVLIVYQAEAHPAGTSKALVLNQRAGFAIPAAANAADRRKAAAEAAARLHLPASMVSLDAITNATSIAYGSLPNMTFLLDGTGKLVGAWPWMAPSQVNGAVQDQLANRPIPQRLMGPGFSRQAGPPLEFDARFLPPGSLQGLAAALDDAGVTRPALRRLLPELQRFTSSLIQTREAIVQMRRRGQYGQSFRQSLREILAKARQRAADFKKALRQTVSAEQYRRIYADLDRGKLRRVFDSGN